MARIRTICLFIIFICSSSFLTFLVITNFTQSSYYTTYTKNVKLYLCNSSTSFESNFTTTESSELLDIPTRIREITACFDRSNEARVEQKGEFFAIYNYVAADKYFRCHESVTYTTQADFLFMDNIVELAERWRGPISLAIFAPGNDYAIVVKMIAYLRNCETELVRQFVSFHLVFPIAHFDDTINYGTYTDAYNCNEPAPHTNITKEQTYKFKNNLTYPINVVRNVARAGATTHFVLASDIELYPSENFIPKFLEMIASGEDEKYERRHVYALAVFELQSGQDVPQTKTELIRKLKNRNAVWFHQRLCDVCHAIPLKYKWIAEKESDTYRGFAVTKRQGRYKMWEAFYVGTHQDPVFDERMIWEGQYNKMVQGYAMCLLDYDYVVLDNAFLVHKPGIKKFKEQNRYYTKLVINYTKLAKQVVKPQLDALYGKRDGCFM